MGQQKHLKKYWTKWREEELPESHFVAIKNKPLPEALTDALFQQENRTSQMKAHFKALWADGELPTEQDRLLISLLSPERLLEFIQYFILFDKKKGKIAARYQQVEGVKLC